MITYVINERESTNYMRYFSMLGAVVPYVRIVNDEMK